MKKTKKVSKGQMTNTKLRKNSRLVSQDAEDIQKPHHYFIKNVEIEFDSFQQLIEDVNIESCINSETKGLSLKRLVSFIEKKYNIFAKDKLIKFYLEEGQVYLTVPSAKKAFSSFQIQQDDYLTTKTIKLQLFKNKELIDVAMQDSQEQSDENGDDEEEIQNDQKALEGKCRRLKQRKIKHVIQKVLKWRQLYAPENGNQNQKVSLDEGAKMVKISKKTLDDYLSQLKKGKKYGFNFNDHKNQKIGVLREFIRKMQKKR